MSPWTELIYAVRAALRGEASVRGVAVTAARCRFIARETHGTAALHYNALKTMAEAWPDEPALRDPIAQLLSLCELNPIKFLPRPAPKRPATIAKPWWVT